MKRTAAVLLVCITVFSPSTHTGRADEGRRLVRLEGGAASVTVDLGGGSIADFHMRGRELNPLAWNHPEPGDTTARGMGHFICFDRLGQSTAAERANGMPGHGEAAHIDWKLLSGPHESGGEIVAAMSCDLPLAGMTMKRTMRLSKNAPVLHVTEEATNTNLLGKVYNLVQHPSIGGPFLDGNLLIDSNAGIGFYRGNPFPDLEKPAIRWPQFTFDGRTVDIRRVEEEQEPGVVNFTCSEDAVHGWVTACNPAQRLLLGYVWLIGDYPWLRIWRHNRDGAPLARGIEFGTTPLPLPFKFILAKNTIFDRPVYDWLDAGEGRIRSYTAFLAEIPADYRGVGEIAVEEGRFVLKEYGGGTGREITVTFR